MPSQKPQWLACLDICSMECVWNAHLHYILGSLEPKSNAQVLQGGCVQRVDFKRAPALLLPR